MPVVKLKIDDIHRPLDEILNLFEEATGFELMYYRRENDILALFMTSEQHVDFVMTADVRAALAKEGVQVVKSEEYLANSTIIAKNVPWSLHEKSLEDIANDIMLCNDVEAVTVDWKGTNTLFIEFNTIEDATKVLNSPDGIKLSYERSITDVTKKPYLNIPQCPRCFSFEHESKNCPKTVRTCYHCGEDGHAGDECSTSYVRCANCGGDHVAFAFKCPVRKQKESEMKEDGWCPPDTVDGGASTEDDDSTKRAEEEVSIILGLDKLRCESPEQCDDNEDPDFVVLSGNSCIRTRADPTGLSGLACKPSGALDTGEDAVDGGQPRGSVESAKVAESSGASALDRPPNRIPLQRRGEDPLPVSPNRTPDPNRPQSRLGDPATHPILRPVPRSSSSASAAPSRPKKAEDARKGH